MPNLTPLQQFTRKTKPPSLLLLNPGKLGGSETYGQHSVYTKRPKTNVLGAPPLISGSGPAPSQFHQVLPLPKAPETPPPAAGEACGQRADPPGSAGAAAQGFRPARAPLGPKGKPAHRPSGFRAASLPAPVALPWGRAGARARRPPGPPRGFPQRHRTPAARASPAGPRPSPSPTWPAARGSGRRHRPPGVGPDRPPDRRHSSSGPGAAPPGSRRLREAAPV